MPTIQRKQTKSVRGADDHLTITRPDQLHALSNATRWKIVGRLLDGPASVQELARSLRTAKGTIGHHVRVLERAGLIRVVERRKVRGVVEKRYARVARQYRLPEREAAAALSPHEDLTTMPLRQAVAEARPAAGQHDPSMSLVVRARMPAERAHRFAAMLEVLAAEFSDGAPSDGEPFGFVAGIYVPDWTDETASED
jgi:DNA-binding transcriptional ArsR family regulator